MGDFDVLYAQHLPAVFRYALHCVGRRDIAEEITAEAFLVLYRNLAGIDPAQLPGWLLTVVRRRAVDYWRREQLEQRVLAAADDMNHHANLTSSTTEHAIEQWLLEICKGLKPAHRACLLLRFVQGMTRAEIARELGLTENQVKSNLQYALELLRRALQDTSAHATR